MLQLILLIYYIFVKGDKSDRRDMWDYVLKATTTFIKDLSYNIGVEKHENIFEWAIISRDLIFFSGQISNASKNMAA